jgi:hypothetical protein
MRLTSRTVQTLDHYGNLLMMQGYNFGNGAVGSLARTYTNTYLGGTNYTSRYIFNLKDSDHLADAHFLPFPLITFPAPPAPPAFSQVILPLAC